MIVQEKPYYIEKDSFNIPNFDAKISAVSCFMEHKGKVLLLKKNKEVPFLRTWSIPGGRIEKSDESPFDAIKREVFEETNIHLQNADYIGARHIRIPNCPDYILHIFKVVLEERPDVRLSEEHIDAKWVLLHNFKSFNLLRAQGSIFDIVYGDRFWQKTVDEGSRNVSFHKREHSIEFQFHEFMNVLKKLNFAVDQVEDETDRYIEWIDRWCEAMVKFKDTMEEKLGKNEFEKFSNRFKVYQRLAQTYKVRRFIITASKIAVNI